MSAHLLCALSLLENRLTRYAYFTNLHPEKSGPPLVSQNVGPLHTTDSRFPAARGVAPADFPTAGHELYPFSLDGLCDVSPLYRALKKEGIRHDCH